MYQLQLFDDSMYYQYNAIVLIVALNATANIPHPLIFHRISLFICGQQ